MLSLREEDVLLQEEHVLVPEDDDLRLPEEDLQLPHDEDLPLVFLRGSRNTIILCLEGSMLLLRENIFSSD